MYPNGLQSSPQLWDLMNEVAAVAPHKWKYSAIQLKLYFERVQSIQYNSVSQWIDECMHLLLSPDVIVVQARGFDQLLLLLLH